MSDPLDIAILEFFEGVLKDNKRELLPVSRTLSEFGSQGTTRYAGDRSSLEHWIVKRLAEACPDYVRRASGNRGR